MKTKSVPVGCGLILALSCVALEAAAAPACKGPNKNDPGCTATVVSTAASVESVTVDWLNQKFVVRGDGFAEATEFLLGGGLVPLATANITATELDIPFSADVAAVVDSAGSYNLFVDGAMQMSVFLESQVIDPAATGCVCEADWMAELGSLYTDMTADCLEVEGPGSNDAADISGTIPSDPGNVGTYPQYPIGASFYPGEPENSVCRLVQVDASAGADDLVIRRINENQQADCAAALKLNVCATVNGL